MHAMHKSHFEEGIQEEGEFKGRRYLKLAQYGKDKCIALSLNNPWIRVPKETAGRIVENPDDPFCTVKLWDLYVHSGRFLPKTYVGRLFRRKASRKQLLLRQTNFQTNQEPYFEADMNSTGVVGKNSVSTIIKAIATRCGFDNFADHTGRSNRRRMLTKLSADNGVSQAEMNDVARHGGTKNGQKISGEYQETITKSSDNRMKATLYGRGKVHVSWHEAVFFLPSFLIF